MTVAAPTLDEVRTWIGNDQPIQGASAEARLESAYAAAVEGVEGKVLSDFLDGTEAYPAGVRQAIFLVAHRLYTRAASPQGIGGFDSLGNVYRILTQDPDVKAVVGPYLDLAAMFS